MKNKDIKRQALKTLTNSWGQAAVVILFILVIFLLFTLAGDAIFNYLKYKGEIDDMDFILTSENKYMIMINIIRAVIGFIIITPAYFGAEWWFLHCVRGEDNSIAGMFVCYENRHIFFKALALKLTVYLIRLTAVLPVCALIILEYRLIAYTMIQGISNGILVILIGCCGIFTICSVCFAINFMLRYILADYIFVLNPDLKITEILKSSAKQMKDNKSRIVKLFLSFLWWLPSCILVFPAFFVAPYYLMSFTILINNILEKNFVTERNPLSARGEPSIIS